MHWLRFFQGLSAKKCCITKTFILLYDFETIFYTVQSNRPIYSICSWMDESIAFGAWMLLLLFLECECKLQNSDIQKWSLKDRFAGHWKCKRRKFYSWIFLCSSIRGRKSLEKRSKVTEWEYSKFIVNSLTDFKFCNFPKWKR